MKNLFSRYIYASPNVSNIDYFQNPSPHHGVWVGKELEFFFAKKHSHNNFIKTVCTKRSACSTKYYKIETLAMLCLLHFC